MLEKKLALNNRIIRGQPNTALNNYSVAHDDMNAFPSKGLEILESVAHESQQKQSQYPSSALGNANAFARQATATRLSLCPRPMN